MLAMIVDPLLWVVKVVQLAADVLGLVILALPVEPVAKVTWLTVMVILTMVGSLVVDLFGRVDNILGAPRAATLRQILSGFFNPALSIVFGLAVLFLLHANLGLPALVIVIALWAFFVHQTIGDAITAIWVR